MFTQQSPLRVFRLMDDYKKNKYHTQADAMILMRVFEEFGKKAINRHIYTACMCQNDRNEEASIGFDVSCILLYIFLLRLLGIFKIGKAV